MVYYLQYLPAFSTATKMSRYDTDPTESVINWPPGIGSDLWFRIMYLRMRPERNIYRSLFKRSV